MRLKPLQDALFPCSYPVIEDLWTTWRTDIVGNELSPLHCNNYCEGRWTGQDNRLYGPSELCGNERSASPSPFTERFCWVTLPTTGLTLPKQSALFFKVNDSDLNIWFSLLFLWAGDVLWEWDREHQAQKHVQKNQPGCENKLQHFANEHDTTLWRQHRFLTEWIRDTLLELFQRCEQNTNNWQAVLFNF